MTPCESSTSIFTPDSLSKREIQIVERGDNSLEQRHRRRARLQPTVQGHVNVRRRFGWPKQVKDLRHSVPVMVPFSVTTPIAGASYLDVCLPRISYPSLTCSKLISHTDLDRAVAFYRDQLALPLAHIFPERKVAFFWTGETTAIRKSSLVADNSASRSTGGRNL